MITQMRIYAIAPFIAIFLLVAHDASAQIRSQLYLSGLSAPVGFVHDPTDARVQFVVQQGGRIRAVHDGVVQATDFLDLTGSITSGGERGLLGLAFPPDSASTGRFYVNFTNTNGDTVIARFRRSSDPLVADPGSRFDLMFGGQRFIAQPFANHKGGHLAFGPDGFLYIGLGDGGSGNDPGHRAQNPNDLLGKMLRIDVAVPDANQAGFAVPANNPFVDGLPIAARPEIWAFGLRNPWRYAFDDPARGGTGALIIADVGQSSFEEINYEPRASSGFAGGRNYGWRNREGAHDNIITQPPAYHPLSDPILEYSHAEGQSITGGFVYRGNALEPHFKSRYFFADFSTGRVWSMVLLIDSRGEARASDLREHTAELGGFSRLGNISSFGLDAQGELYIVSYFQGSVLKILGSTVAAPRGLRITVP